MINGDDDAAEGDEFDVTGSAFNDTVVLDTYLRADVNAGAGTDTLDLRDVGLALVGLDADVNLSTGVASAVLAGTFINFENVIANENGGRLVGTTGANVITLGEGTDDISAAGGDDTILADEDTLNAADDIDGGSGTDTLSIDGMDTLNLATAFDALNNVENILLTGTEDADVALTLANLFDSATTATAIVGGIRDVKIADVGGDNVVTITRAANTVNLLGVTFTNVQTIEMNAGGVFRVDSNTLKGVSVIDGTVGDDLTLTGGTYDFSGIDFNTMTEIDGSDTSNDTVLFGKAIGDIADVDLGASIADEVSFAGTDVGDISGIAAAGASRLLGVETVSFGSASRVVIDEGLGAAIGAIKGTASEDTLVIQQEAVDADAAVFTNVKISGVETILFDSAGVDVDFTIGASTLEAATVVVGDTGADEVIFGESGIDVSKVSFKDFERLDIGANTASISVATFGNFGEIDGNTNGVLTFTDSGSATLTSITAGVSGDVRLQAFSGADTWTLSSFNAAATATDLRLGAGNDTVTVGSTNTLTNTIVRLEDGDDTFSLGANAATLATGVVSGGAGTDTLVIGGAVAVGDLGAAQFLGFETLKLAGPSTATFTIALQAADVAVSTIDLSADTTATGDVTVTLTGYDAAGYTVIGTAGNDTFTLGGTTSTVNGGAGNDTFNVNGAVLAAAAAAQTFTVSGGTSGTDVYTFGANTVLAGTGQHNLVINDYSAGDDINVAAIIGATALGNATDVELAQSVAQAIVNAANPGSLGAAFDALSAHANSLGVAITAAFQYNGNTYVYVDGVAGATRDATNDFFITVTGLQTIAAADLIT